MFQGFKNFFSHPFSEDMSAGDWFLFIGLLLLILIAWHLILSHLLAELD